MKTINLSSLREAVQKKKGRNSLFCFVLFCLNAYQGASEADNSNLDYWLFQAGFTRHDKDSMGPDKWNKLKKKQL